MPRGRPLVKRVSIACAGCGVVVERRPSDIRGRRVFCNIECARRSGLKPKTGTERPCETCGKPMWVARGAIHKRFCSRPCHAVGLLRGEMRKCQTCGTSFRVTPSIGARKFCGHKCAAQATMQRPQDRQYNGRPVLKDPNGYIKVYEPDHPRNYGGWVFEHRWLMEQHIGRFLNQKEHVHHINGVKDDNRLENLAVLSHSEHSSITGQERTAKQQELEAKLAEYERLYGPLPKE